MKWECNACADTEGGYLPCEFENKFTDDEPEFCPHSKEECEWEEIKEGGIMDKVREEFEKKFHPKLPQYWRSLEQYEDTLIGYKSRDEEIKKLKSLAEEYQESYIQIEQKNKKLKDQLSRLESHMGLPDLKLK